MKRKNIYLLLAFGFIAFVVLRRMRRNTPAVIISPIAEAPVIVPKRNEIDTIGEQVFIDHNYLFTQQQPTTEQFLREQERSRTSTNIFRL